jgi:hypothetical protein
VEVNIDTLRDETAEAIADYQDAIDKQAATIQRLMARRNAARQLLVDPNLKAYRRTYVGSVLENLRALLAEDVA